MNLENFKGSSYCTDDEDFEVRKLKWRSRCPQVSNPFLSQQEICAYTIDSTRLRREGSTLCEINMSIGKYVPCVPNRNIPDSNIDRTLHLSLQTEYEQKNNRVVWKG